MKINLSDYTWEEVRDLAGSDPVILLPLGAFEQHGKHLPLKVDEFMVNNIANEAVRKSHQKNIFAVVAPVIWSGYSPHHMDFPGTISIKDETLSNLMIDIVESLVKNKLERIKKICSDKKIDLSEVAYIGDDINDIEVLKAVGFSALASNSPIKEKIRVDYITTRKGGDGAFREFVDLILEEK